MIRLLEYLDADGWLETPFTRTAKRGDWIYYWQVGTEVGVHLGTARLIRRLNQREKGADIELELFIIKGEDRCLEIAKELNDEKHLDSPLPDPKTGKRIAYL